MQALLGFLLLIYVIVYTSFSIELYMFVSAIPALH